MLFSDLLGSMVRTGETWTVRVPSDWLQGRSVFGGLQAALAFRAMRDIAPEHPLRVIQTTFIAPVHEGIVQIEAKVLRTGKTTVHAEARVFDGGALAAIAIAIFGKSRPSSIQVLPRPRVVNHVPVRAQSAKARTCRSRRSSSTSHARWLQGGPPGSGIRAPETIVEIGIKDTGPLTCAHILAIADATPPVALSMLKTPALGSSSLTLDARDDPRRRVPERRSLSKAFASTSSSSPEPAATRASRRSSGVRGASRSR